MLADNCEAIHALEFMGALMRKTNLVKSLKKASAIVSGWSSRSDKVVCVGLGKTGTSSFARAMQILGFRHCTMGGGVNNFYDRKMIKLRMKMASYDSFDDFPWCFLYEQFEQSYPKTRFVLTVRRSPEAWLDSLKKHYCRTGPTFAKYVAYGYFSPYQNLKHHLSLYKDHNEKIRQHFKGSPNFLEVCWEDGDGWEELCGFLGVEAPRRPFPRANVAPEIDYGQARRRADEMTADLLAKRTNLSL